MAYYAKLLTRDYLEYLGITNVSEDGKHIYRNDKELKQQFNGAYKVIMVYDPAIRQSVPKDLRTNATGQFILPVQRVVYAWFNNIIPEKFVVDHKNDNKCDNNINNLQLLTPGQNI